ncbi:MAG: hypothetical protein K940chlam3_01767 [Chlamydiae bacterium]|nr:hypothetical protein [Chlamydiota bacterium]
MSITKSNQQLIRELHEEVKALRAENRALRKLVKDLEEKLNTNSYNSSKSPSQDPNRSRKGKKKPSEKKQGAQKGRKGHDLDQQLLIYIKNFRVSFVLFVVNKVAERLPF